jgi:GTP-binding protein LepA
MLLRQIRNFSIIAHIDHGKSTLADRLLEITGTVEKRKMREQVLDMMDLERERGITIKMQPVRLCYQSSASGEEYLLNLIDTPGHIDFSYEVSRSLKAVEGVLLLVDATQGVQAQTLSVLQMARDLELKIIPVINKIDLAVARVEETKQEIVELLNCEPEEIVAVSGKTGEGVAELLERIVKEIPPPEVNQELEGKKVRALVFDFEYSNHQGVIVYARVSDGLIKTGDELVFHATGEKFKVLEVGNFRPQKTVVESLGAGEIGYVVTGIKKPGQAAVGDTIENLIAPLPPFPGYAEPSPVVWASIYPESQDDLMVLRQALIRLKLSDAALSFEEEASTSLGRGFRCGFLGLLHLEIITERLKREFNMNLVIATPTIGYEIEDEKTGVKEFIYSPHLFPEDTKGKKIFEPWVAAKIIVPPDYASNIIKLLNEHEAVLMATENFSAGRVVLSLELPLRELMRNFFDEIKSVSSGFASFSYALIGDRLADVVRMDVLVNEGVVPAFSRIVSRRKVDREGQDVVERLKEILPRQLISIKIQAKSYGRIVAARAISAMRKDVTDYLYGGDITRKMKLREKQKKGKKKMQKLGSVNIPQDVFLKMINNSDR